MYRPEVDVGKCWYMGSDTERSTVNNLTRKQSLFVDFYIQTLNATESARLAKYAKPNTQGPRLLQNPAIEEEIETRLAKHHASAEEVLAVLSSQMRGSMDDFIEIDEVTGDPAIDLQKAKKQGKLGLLKEFETLKKSYINSDGDETITERVKIKLHDPQSAAVHLGKYHKLFTDKTELTGKDGESLQTVVNINIPDNGRSNG